MVNALKTFALAAAATAALAIAPMAANASVVTGGSGWTGNPSCSVTGSSADSWATVSVLGGANFNSTFSNGDPAGHLCFNFTNSSASAAAVTLAVATVNQYANLWGFTNGVNLASEQLGNLWDVAQGENATKAFKFNIAANSTIFFDWTYGAAYATGFSLPQINFSVTAAAVPVPAAGVLLLGGLGAMGALRRRKKATV